MSKKIKEITIALNQDYVMWDVDLSNIERETEVFITEGCLGIYLVNGVLKSVLTPGKCIVKSKDEDKSNATLKLIAVSSDKVYNVMLGVGKIPFKDWELNTETLVGAHGVCKVRVLQPYTIYTQMGKANVKVEDIDDYIRSKASELMSSALAELLQKYDYQSITTQQSKLAEELQKRFALKLGPDGIEMQSFALEGIFFSEEYKTARKEFFDKQNQKKEEKEARREKEREQRAEIEVIKSLTAGNTSGVQTINVNVGAQDSFKFCSKCGTKAKADSLFCSKCGNSLN